MKTSLPRIRVGNLALVAFTLLLGGCATISDSLKLESAILVKVPIKQPIAEGRGQGWEFRHVLEAPKSDGRAGEWYVAWNNAKPFRSSFFSPYWIDLFSRAPEIADATRAAFGAYPVLIEPNRTFSRVASKQPPEPKPGEVVKSEYGSGTRLVVNKLPTKSMAG